MRRLIAFARGGWLTPILLVALTAVPAAAGAARLVWLATGEIRPDSARFAEGPAPLVLHIVSACLFGLLGAFQFAPGLRARWPAWHRSAGRILVPTGILAAVTGLWLTLFYPPGVNDGELLYCLRLFFGSAMAGSLLLGFGAIRRRDVAQHKAWMLRGYAIGMGAGTQVLVFLPWFLFVGPAGDLPRALLMGAAWVINLAVAEWVIRRKRGSRPGPRHRVLPRPGAQAPHGAATSLASGTV